MNTFLLILLLNLHISTGMAEPAPIEQTYQKIGYTTQYGNGFNNTSTFDYTSGRSGQPRRVVIKHGNDSIDTGRYDDWNQEWNYYHGSVLGIGYDERWYYKDGDDMYFWNGHDWEHTGRWDWIHTHDPSGAHSSAPVGDPSLFVILGLLFLWIVFDILKHMTNKDDQ